MRKHKLDWNDVEKIIDNALREDVGDGDITTEALFDRSISCHAVIRSKEDGILCGLPVAQLVFERLDGSLKWNENKKDGDLLKEGDKIVEVVGNQKHILTGERLALNILQRMSGISTLTSKFVKEVSDLNVKIVDTRKTVPGFRSLGKYAVTIGGGYNHRFGLFDGVLIKDNHIKLAGTITDAVSKIRSKLKNKYKIEVETKKFDQVKEAVSAGADIIMLDNMSVDDMKTAVKYINGVALVEASGGITLSTVRDVAKTGVDFISVGALTHSAKALDISLDML
ncbi:MAG: carboxylating nicotinate-nucleotide diphosphorylase [Candidatus Dadabacteria bacterium]|nr:carboxylating nicotinate-nucleotide diphosphorylase [Candidatus Dadabacteria bacterium]NIQ15223.1 carboxylating nicotinate-nucleotide diphosphorylase [Candidatus Dadabacteria bacterium]